MRRVLVILGLAAKKAWLVFSAIATVGAVFFAWFDGDNLLRSDDPYIPSAILGIVAAVLAASYVLACEITSRPIIAHVACIIMLCLWCGLLLAVGMNAREGGDLAWFFSIASVVAGLLAWPLFTFAWRRKWEIAVTCLGVLFLIGRAHAAMYLASRVF